jgi:hypothetical protein
MREPIKTIILCTMTATLLGLPGFAFACSCATTATSDTEEVKSWLASSEEVVLAEAVSIDVFPSTFDGGNTETQRVKWKVNKSWKGVHEKDGVLITETVITCCMCGVRVKQGQQFLLFGSRPEPFSISNCSLSGLAAERRAQIGLLDKLAGPHDKAIKPTR